ncbi:transcriptional regulator, PaaX family [Formosa sp. Hel1_33_131]|nr:transcriptional regulator, PaaX family [Formosa sp. Hel1_33_131]
MLVKFFINAANSGYLNGLAVEFGESTNAIRRELNNLSDAGYLIQWKNKTKSFILRIPTTRFLKSFKKSFISTSALNKLLNQF